MDERLENALAVILEKAVSGVDFVVGQAPDVVQQLLLWKFWAQSLWVGWGITMFMVGIIGVVWACREYKGNFGRDVPPAKFMPSVCLVSCGLVCFLGNIEELLLIWLAPKIYILEYAASLVK